MNGKEEGGKNKHGRVAPGSRPHESQRSSGVAKLMGRKKTKKPKRFPKKRDVKEETFRTFEIYL